MKQGLFILLIVAGCLVGCATEPYLYHHRARSSDADTAAVITNHDVIMMSKARIGDDAIIDLLHASPTDFRLGPREVVALADSGVSDRVIRAMIKIANSPEERERVSWYPYWYPWGPYWFSWSAWYPWYRPYAFWYGRPSYFYRPYFRHYSFSAPHGSFGRGPGGTRSIGRHR